MKGTELLHILQVGNEFYRVGGDDEWGGKYKDIIEHLLDQSLTALLFSKLNIWSQAPFSDVVYLCCFFHIEHCHFRILQSAGWLSGTATDQDAEGCCFKSTDGWRSSHHQHFVWRNRRRHSWREVLRVVFMYSYLLSLNCFGLLYSFFSWPAWSIHRRPSLPSVFWHSCLVRHLRIWVTQVWTCWSCLPAAFIGTSMSHIDRKSLVFTTSLQ